MRLGLSQTLKMNPKDQLRSRVILQSLYLQIFYLMHDAIPVACDEMRITCNTIHIACNANRVACNAIRVACDMIRIAVL